MCGICGAVTLTDHPLVVDESVPERMIGALRHRGPDEFGAWRDDRAFLGHARLSIIDLSSGQQPMTTGDGTLWITFNGEIFNYPELTGELESLGHRFRTRSDTEVILHAFDEWGPDCLGRFNGQFAFAIWDSRRRKLFLARDRFGIRPLFITEADGVLLFGSEIKSLLAWPDLDTRLDSERIAEIFTYWVNIPPATAFENIHQLPPGHHATLDLSRSSGTGPWPGGLQVRRYWHPAFLSEEEERIPVDSRREKDLADQLREHLVRAATLRLRADVPVGAYLSGGLDSSATVAVIDRYTDNRLQCFGVGFSDRGFDESDWQRSMAEHIGVDLKNIAVDDELIAGQFPDVVWHAETPILRTAPSPLFSLSGLARDHGYKVVLTGEGADEVLVGYNIFREAKVRRFWSRNPGDQRRAMLLTRLYPYLEQSPPSFLARFYGTGLDRTDDPFFSHRPRWSNTGMMTTFIRSEAVARFSEGGAESRLLDSLPDEFSRWGPVGKSQYLEMTTFMSGYLLSSQGDRMLMGHSVEGRFPFLDHELAEFAASIPSSLKLRSLREKSIFKKSVADLLPTGILAREKQPYRAPVGTSFLGNRTTALVEDHMSADALEAAGLWNTDRVLRLQAKWRSGRLTSARENMGWLGVLSGQILARQTGPELKARLARHQLMPEELCWRNGAST